MPISNMINNLILFDFDRSSGILSNPIETIVYTGDTIVGLPTTIEFSANSRYLYLATVETLWQLDTYEEVLEDGLELIDVWDGFSDPFSTTFAIMKLAPDCKIYMCSYSSTNTYHVINNPDEKGEACDFVQRGIKLPFTSSVANMPNFPRFRVDVEDKCDPSITSVFGHAVFYRKDLSIYPNPVISELQVELPEGYQGDLVVFDMQGQLVWKGAQSSYQGNLSVDLSFLLPGSYSMEFIPKDNSERLIWTSLLVKI